MIKNYLCSSIGKKQIVALTGLLLVGFLVFHLSMNLLIFGGADLYNFFPNKAHENVFLLRLIEAGLASIFFAHIGFTVSLVLSNKKARGQSYAVEKSSKKRSLATRLMPYTGMILLLFLFFHIKEFVFVDHESIKAVVIGKNMGLYGVVFNAFTNLFRVVAYVVAMFAVGFHLAHGIQSVCQSYGFNHPIYTPIIQKMSTGIGVVMAIAFSSVPVYVYLSACCQV